MTEKIFEFIKKEHLLSDGDTVVCGLSGGADSVSLLLAMNELKERLNITVEAVHVNHCLRGDESDRDEEFCRKLCEKLGVAFNSFRVDVKSYAAANSLSDEEAARKLRYGVFADNTKGKKIATAHNANDNLETVILNLARGSALKGMAGIPVKRDNIIRPLLTVSREEIESFLNERGQDYVTDSTNLSDNYTRNKIRHNIIPLLRELNNSVISTSVRSIGAMRSENDLIEDQTDEAERICRLENSFNGLEKFPSVIRRRCIARLLSENSLPYSSDRLEEADHLAVDGGKMNVSGNIYLISDGHSMMLKEINDKNEQQSVETELKIGENSIFSDKTLFCQIVECDDLKKFLSVHSLLTFCLLDYDKIRGRVVVRNRKFGDKMQLRGRNFTSSVKKLINEKVPQEQRSTLHFLEDSEGTFFAEKIGIAQRVAPDKNTKRYLVISVKNTDRSGSFDTKKE